MLRILKRHIDLLALVAGIILLGIGAAWWHRPAGLVVPGALLVALSLWEPGARKRGK